MILEAGFACETFFNAFDARRSLTRYGYGYGYRAPYGPSDRRRAEPPASDLEPASPSLGEGLAASGKALARAGVPVRSARAAPTPA